LRHADDGYEEAGRGVHAKAVRVWNALVTRHRHQAGDAS
jgi:hypothetical protein